MTKTAKKYRSEELRGSRILSMTHSFDDLSIFIKAAETLNLHRASINYVQSSDSLSQKVDGTRFMSR